jgi:glutamine amidotransferase
MDQLLAAGGDLIIQERIAAARPILGICVGMQILFDSGSEKGGSSGLGVFSGDVSQIDAPILPHIGWNTVEADPESRLFNGISEERFYFVHSFAAKRAVDGAHNSWCSYGEDFVAAVERGLVSAVQFHPEKSGAVGARLIANWVGTL